MIETTAVLSHALRRIKHDESVFCDSGREAVICMLRAPSEAGGVAPCVSGRDHGGDPQGSWLLLSPLPPPVEHPGSAPPRLRAHHWGGDTPNEPKGRSDSNM